MACNFQGTQFLKAWNQRRKIGGDLADLANATEKDFRSDQVSGLANGVLSAVEEFDAMLARVGLDAKTMLLKAAQRADAHAF